MPRCHTAPLRGACRPVRAFAAHALALPLLATALLAPPPAGAQDAFLSGAPQALDRTLPPGSLRGEIEFTQPPEVRLNGQPARLSPGSRIRGQNNLLVMWGAAIGQKAKVNYTVDTYGLLSDVWVLRDDELKRLWPKTAQEAAAWTYDPVSKTWSKR